MIGEPAQDPNVQGSDHSVYVPTYHNILRPPPYYSAPCCSNDSRIVCDAALDLCPVRGVLPHFTCHSATPPFLGAMLGGRSGPEMTPSLPAAGFIASSVSAQSNTYMYHR